MGNPKFDNNNSNNTKNILGWVIRNINLLIKKISKLESTPTASDLDSVLTAGNTSPNKNIELGGYQQQGYFKTIVTSLFGAFSSTVIKPNLIEFERDTNKTTLTGSSGMNEEVNVELPNEDGVLAVRERIVLENSYWEDETSTGRIWVDGKTIYKKVIPFTFNVNGFAQFDLTSYDISTPISSNAILTTTSGKVTEFNSDYRTSPSAQVVYFESRFYDDGGYFLYVGHRTVELSTGANTTTQSNRPGYVVIEYTKNTELGSGGGPGPVGPEPDTGI